MNSTDTTHTPTPWRFVLMGRDEVALWGNNGLEIGLLYGSNGLDEPYTINAIANAELIVRACNAHDDLVEALSDLTDLAHDAMNLANNDGGFYDTDDCLREARAALAKARGEQP